MIRTLASGMISSITTGEIVLLVLAVFFLTIVLLSTQRRIRKSRADSGRSTATRYLQLRDQHAATHEIDAVMLELDKLSREIQARLDTKLARLECLIRDADQRISRLGKLAGDARKEPSFEVTLSEEMPVSQQRPSVPSEDRHRDEIHRLADEGLPASQIAEQVGRPQGEVDLILALRRASARHSDAPIATAPTQPK